MECPAFATSDFVGGPCDAPPRSPLGTSSLVCARCGLASRAAPEPRHTAACGPHRHTRAGAGADALARWRQLGAQCPPRTPSRRPTVTRKTGTCTRESQISDNICARDNVSSCSTHLCDAPWSHVNSIISCGHDGSRDVHRTRRIRSGTLESQNCDHVCAHDNVHWCYVLLCDTPRSAVISLIGYGKRCGRSVHSLPWCAHRSFRRVHSVRCHRLHTTGR